MEVKASRIQDFSESGKSGLLHISDTRDYRNVLKVVITPRGWYVSNLVIRPFRNGEEKLVACIRNLGFSEWVENLGDGYWERYVTTEDISRWVSGDFIPRSELWIAELNGVPVGYARCGRKDNHLLYLPTDWGHGDFGQSEVTVIPKYRRQGVGKELIDRTLRHYGRQGVKAASVRIYSDNVASSVLLRDLNFIRHETDAYLELDLRRPIMHIKLNPKVKVREVREEDVDALVKVYRQSGLGYGRTSPEWIRSWLNEHHSVKCDVTLIAEHEDKIVGVMTFLVNSTLDIPGVLPEYRRRGIGSTLFYHLLKRMQKKGYAKAIADVSLGNQAALQMYRRSGFIMTRKICRWKKII